MISLSKKNISKYLLCFFLLLMTIFVMLLNNSGLNNYSTISIWIGFITNLVLIFISFYVNGIDFITFYLICTTALLFPIMIQYFTNSSYGDLSLNLVFLHMPQLINYNYIYCFLFLLLSIIFDYRKKELDLVELRFNNKKNLTIVVNNLVAVLFTFVAFPRLGFSSSANERFNMLLPGHAWNQLAIVALIFNFPYLRKKTSVKLTYLFVVSWFLINGERADITGLVLGISIYILMEKSGQKDLGKILRAFLIFLFLFLFLVLLNSIATLRNGQEVTFLSEVKGLLTTPTTSDVGYLFNVAIDYEQCFGTLKGQLLKANLISAIPFTSPSGFNTFTEAVKYFNPGGEPILAMPIMDFGIKGIYFVSILDFLFFRIFVQYKNLFFKYEFILMLSSIPRMVWYGRSYTYSSILFFVPILFIVNYFIDKYSK